MKKIFLSLTLLSSAPLMSDSAAPAAEAAPEPVVQDKAVIDAVNYAEATVYNDEVEFEAVTDQIINTGAQFVYAGVSKYEQARIIRALTYLAETRQLTSRNFEMQKALVVAHIVQCNLIRMGERTLISPAPAQIAVMYTRELKDKMDLYGAQPWLIKQYMGYNAEDKFKHEANKKKYDWYRRR